MLLRLARAYRVKGTLPQVEIPKQALVLQRQLESKYPYTVYKDRFLIHHKPHRQNLQLLCIIRKTKEIQQFHPELNWREASKKGQKFWNDLTPDLREKELMQFGQSNKAYQDQMAIHQKQMTIANRYHASTYTTFLKMCFQNKLPELFVPQKGVLIKDSSKKLSKIWNQLPPQKKQSFKDFQKDIQFQKFRAEREIPKKVMVNSFIAYSVQQAKISNKPISEVRSEWAVLPAQSKNTYQAIFKQHMQNYKIQLDIFLKRHSLTADCLKEMRSLSKAIAKLQAKPRNSKAVKSLQELSDAELNDQIIS